MGAGYNAYAVSTQVVSGINYRFLCTRTLATADLIKTIVIVTVNCSPDGKITRMDDIQLKEE
jgi:hypothetical protein